MITNPQPAPQPSGPQPSGAQNPSGIQLPQNGAASSASKYGLGALSGVTISFNDQQVTAEDAMDRLLQQSSPDQIAQLQSWLYKGGAYGSKPPPNLGVWSKDDISALSDAVSVAAQTQVPLLDYVRRQAAYGVYSGIASAVSGRQASASASGQVTITKEDPRALAQMIDKEFRALTGRKATDAERAGFVAAFNAAQRANAVANAQAQMGQAGAEMPAAPLPPSYLPEAPQRPATHGFDVVGNSQALTQYGLAQQAWAEQNGGPNVLSAMRRQVGNVLNVAENQRRAAADQQFLALADQPLPGAAGSTGGSAGVSVSTQQAWDPNAFAEDYVRSHATGEVGAHDAADKFGMFLSLLKGVQ